MIQVLSQDKFRMTMIHRALTQAIVIVACTTAGAQMASAVPVLTPGPAGTNLLNVGQDTTNGARASVAPVFPGTFSQVAGGDLTVSGTGDLSPAYNVQQLNDDTGFFFNYDSVTTPVPPPGASNPNVGWIPDTTGLEFATLSFNLPTPNLALSGIDFLTMFTNRGRGIFTFQASTDNQATWTDIFSLTEMQEGLATRQGVAFDPIVGITDVRLAVTTPVGFPAFIGEVDLYTVTVPAPASLPIFAGGLALLGLIARRRKRNATA